MFGLGFPRCSGGGSTGTGSIGGGPIRPYFFGRGFCCNSRIFRLAAVRVGMVIKIFEGSAEPLSLTSQVARSFHVHPSSLFTVFDNGVILVILLVLILVLVVVLAILVVTLFVVVTLLFILTAKNASVGGFVGSWYR